MSKPTFQSTIARPSCASQSVHQKHLTARELSLCRVIAGYSGRQRTADKRMSKTHAECAPLVLLLSECPINERRGAARRDS